MAEAEKHESTRKEQNPHGKEVFDKKTSFFRNKSKVSLMVVMFFFTKTYNFAIVQFIMSVHLVQYFSVQVPNATKRHFSSIWDSSPASLLFY